MHNLLWSCTLSNNGNMLNCLKRKKNVKMRKSVSTTIDTHSQDYLSKRPLFYSIHVITCYLGYYSNTLNFVLPNQWIRNPLLLFCILIWTMNFHFNILVDHWMSSQRSLLLSFCLPMQNAKLWFQYLCWTLNAFSLVFSDKIRLLQGTQSN